jgi:hypothetical protein
MQFSAAITMIKRVKYMYIYTGSHEKGTESLAGKTG